MWSAGRDVTHVYLGQGAVGIRTRVVESEDADRWIRCESALHGWTIAAESLTTDGRRGGRSRVHLWLSGALARPFVFGPIDGLRHWSEALEVAARVAPDSTGLTGPCLAWLDAWRPDRSCGAVAMSRDLRSGIETVAKQHRIRLKSLRPWWAAVLDLVADSPEYAQCQLLSIEDSDSLTMLCESGGDLGVMATYTPVPPLDDLESLLTRRTLGLGFDAKQVVKAHLQRFVSSVPGAIGGRAPFAALEAPPT